MTEEQRDKQRARRRKHRLAHHDLYRKKEREYYAVNREKLRANARRSYIKNPRDNRILGWKRHGIDMTVAKYDILFKEQDACCKICKSHIDDLKERFFDVDHNHVNGKIRGLLCRSCNIRIGFIEKNPHLIEFDLDYLRRNS